MPVRSPTRPPGRSSRHLRDLDLQAGRRRRPARRVRVLALGQPDPDRARVGAGRGRGRRARGFAFASGLAAEDTLLRATLRPGDHVVIPNDAYGGTYRLIARVFGPWGIEHTARRPVRRRRGARRDPARPHQGRLGGDADQPAARHRRHRRAGGARARVGRAAGRRQHVRDARTCSSRSRSAPTSSCTRRRSTSAGTRTSSAVRSSSRRARCRRRRDDAWPTRCAFHQNAIGRGGGAVRRVADAARAQDARRPHGPAREQRRGGRRVPRRRTTR